jgi:hypothetical protein
MNLTSAQIISPAPLPVQQPHQQNLIIPNLTSGVPGGAGPSNGKLPTGLSSSSATSNKSSLGGQMQPGQQHQQQHMPNNNNRAVNQSVHLNPAHMQQHQHPQLLQNCTNILQNNLNIHQQQQQHQLQLQQQQPSSIWGHPGIE